MKKYACAGLLAACLISPAVANNSRLAAKSPDEPLHRRAIVVCMAMIVGLHAYKKSRQTHAERARLASRLR